MSKCPYVPPHPWNVDFPHLMLRAKAYKFKHHGVRPRDKILSSTDLVGSIAGIPVVAEVVNAVNRTAVGRKLLDRALGVHPDAPIPEYHSKTYRKRHEAVSRTAAAGDAGGRHAGQGRAVRDVLRQSQRARSRRGPHRGVRAQRRPRDPRAARTLLRDAQARTRRPRVDRETQGLRTFPRSRNWSTRAGTS